MISSKKKFLVTGADGFIGSHLTELLLKEGHEVRALCYYNSLGSWGWLDDVQENLKVGLEVKLGDIRDPFFMREMVKDVDYVLHLAALIAIPFSYLAPQSYVDTNVTGTLNVLNACRESKVKRIIVTSTSEVYGSAQYVPMDEIHPLQAQSPYAASKIGADQIALSFNKSFGLPVTVLRPFNTFGPRQSARAVIPTIIGQVLTASSEIHLGSISPTRDFTFVEDTAKGFLQVALSQNVEGQVINIGSEFEISIEDIAKEIMSVVGKNLRITTDESRIRPENSEVNRLFCNAEKARRMIQWNPVHSGKLGFKKGLSKTIDWFSSPENLKKYKFSTYNV